MFRISCCIGLVIELWKITKITDVSWDFDNPVLGIIPRLKVSLFFVCLRSHRFLKFLPKASAQASLQVHYDLTYCLALADFSMADIPHQDS